MQPTLVQEQTECAEWAILTENSVFLRQHWGGVMSGGVRTLSLSVLLSQIKQKMGGGHYKVFLLISLCLIFFRLAKVYSLTVVCHRRN